MADSIDVKRSVGRRFEDYAQSYEVAVEALYSRCSVLQLSSVGSDVAALTTQCLSLPRRPLSRHRHRHHPHHHHHHHHHHHRHHLPLGHRISWRCCLLLAACYLLHAAEDETRRHNFDAAKIKAADCLHNSGL
uniref:HDC10384 n=1 Tax=Drosophila melanogaster TaxID=7227 RepID=Q6IL47_DROME|nr:TPA_inf: HDC10384 [Drosophila melanogaster]